MRRCGSATAASRNTCSCITLVQPYGLFAEVGKSSFIGTGACSPYTVAEEEKTSRRTPCRLIAASRENVEPRLLL